MLTPAQPLLDKGTLFLQRRRYSMLWLFGTLVFCAAVVLAGRAHSRRLDALDDRIRLKPLKHDSHVHVVCRHCEAQSIRPGYSDGGPSSTIMKCSVCDCSRGAPGALQSLAGSNRRDLFEA
jgi:hypothetical protein